MIAARLKQIATAKGMARSDIHMPELQYSNILLQRRGREVVPCDFNQPGQEQWVPSVVESSDVGVPDVNIPRGNARERQAAQAQL